MSAFVPRSHVLPRSERRFPQHNSLEFSRAATMLIASLVILNIPVFLLIGWVVFDDHETAAETTIDAVWQALVRSMVPWWMADFILGEDADPFAMLWLAFFVLACIAAVYAEYRFIVWLFPGLGTAAG